MNTVTIPQIVDKLKQRSGLIDKEIVGRMSTYLKRAYTKPTYERKFRNRDAKGPYRVEEMLALIWAFTDNLEYPCRISEAFELFRLAEKGVDSYSRLQPFFSEEDYQQAVNTYLVPETSEAQYISAATQIFMQALMKHTSQNTRKQLDSHSIRTAVSHAFTHAVKQYADHDTHGLVGALTRSDGLLNHPNVAAELAQILRFEREPDTYLIGERWRNLSKVSLTTREFTDEAETLIDFLRGALRITAVFHPVFEQKSLEALGKAALNSQNDEDFEGSPLQQLYAQFAQASPGIRDQIDSFERLIRDKTTDFVGRQFLFDAIKQFIEGHKRGYLIIRGEPGMGKTALMAQWVKQTGAVHHFNIRIGGMNNARDFLRNISAQLIAAYGLPYAALPLDASQEIRFFHKILDEVSKRLTSQQKCLIVVDALDEAENTGLPSGTNTLYLPPSLPDGIYIIVTTRPIPLKLRPEDTHRTIDIEEKGDGNIADIKEYVSAHVDKPGIKTYIDTQQIDANAFIENMTLKSEGNFMYLRYVLPEVERGLYTDMNLSAIPDGLQNYYEKHWTRMKGLDLAGWFDHKLPVLVVLSVVREAVSTEVIREFLEIDLNLIRVVIEEWIEFLNVEPPDEGDVLLKYRLYHASFFDFIASRQEIKEERVNLKAMNIRITNVLWNARFNNQSPGGVQQ
jgi:hypothetical protein